MPVAAIKDTTNIRGLIETAISDLLHNADRESVNLRRESRRVFEDKCLEESYWESWVDEWIDAAYELAGERTSVLDYHDLTDWCTCGHSAADHAYLACDKQTCDCERFKRSRKVARPTPRYVDPRHNYAKQGHISQTSQLPLDRLARVFGREMIADEIISAGGAR